MVYILGKRASGGPVTAKLGYLRFWAERGLVRCVDERDGSYKILSVRDVLERANALSEMLKREPREGFTRWAEVRHKIISFLEEIVPVCREAREQGEPTSPSGRKAALSRRPKHFVVSLSQPESIFLQEQQDLRDEQGAA